MNGIRSAKPNRLRLAFLVAIALPAAGQTWTGSFFFTHYVGSTCSGTTIVTDIEATKVTLLSDGCSCMSGNAGSSTWAQKSCGFCNVEKVAVQSYSDGCDSTCSTCTGKNGWFLYNHSYAHPGGYHWTAANPWGSRGCVKFYNTGNSRMESIHYTTDMTHSSGESWQTYEVAGGGTECTSASPASPPTMPPTSAKKDEKSGDDGGAIVGIAIGAGVGGAVLTAVGVASFCYMKSHPKRVHDYSA